MECEEKQHPVLLEVERILSEVPDKIIGEYLKVDDVFDFLLDIKLAAERHYN